MNSLLKMREDVQLKGNAACETEARSMDILVVNAVLWLTLVASAFRHASSVHHQALHRILMEFSTLHDDAIEISAEVFCSLCLLNLTAKV